MSTGKYIAKPKSQEKLYLTRNIRNKVNVDVLMYLENHFELSSKLKELILTISFDHKRVDFDYVLQSETYINASGTRVDGRDLQSQNTCNNMGLKNQLLQKTFRCSEILRYCL